MMSTNKIAPFGFYNNGQTTDNANNLNKLGLYRIVSLENYQELNYPANNGYIVNQFVSGSGYQLFFYADTTTVYYRHKWNRWSDWIRIDNFGYNSLAELSAGVSPYLFAGVGNNSGLKSGTFTLKTGESISIALGAGVLMLFTDGGQVFSLLGINYWTTEIKTIYTDGRSLNITVTKNDTSGTVTFTAASNRKFHYIFFGE